MDKFEIAIYNALRELEIPPHVRGYEFLKSALRYLRKNPNAIYAITTELYPEVAKLHGEKVKPSHVERGMRHALSLSKVDDAAWLRLMGRAGHMTNGGFLSTLGETIRIKLASDLPEAKKAQ